jgi:dihydrofolate reductase
MKEINKRKIIVYIAMSLDGYIADVNGELHFLDLVTEENEDYGYGEFIKSIDTVIIGRKTYDKVLSFGIPFPHSDKEVYVITHTSRLITRKIHFYTGSLTKLVEELKNSKGKDIFVDGGGEVVSAMIKEDLVDELIISIIPVILGDGIPLFKNNLDMKKLELIEPKSFNKGLVQLHYAIMKNKK